MKARGEKPLPAGGSVRADKEEARKRRRREIIFRLSLCILSGVMLGFSFPPSPFGILACFGLVPFLIVLADLERFGPTLRYAYLTFLVFHIITLNWTGGYAHGNDVYMMIAGAITMSVHPLFYLIPVSLHFFTRKQLGEKAALAALPFIWVAYEYTHALSEWSFPWLTIGNSQSYDITRIQFISATGVYGLSFWILVLNVLTFLFYSALAREIFRPLSKKSLVFAGLILAVYYLPAIHGGLVLSRPAAESRDSIRVGMIQANIDPWEKWNRTGYGVIDPYIRMTGELVGQSGTSGLDLVLWPETAVPDPILASGRAGQLAEIRSRLNSMHVSVLTGLPHAVFYADPRKAPPSAKHRLKTDERYDMYNAAALLQPGVEEIPWYGKMKMVPIAERVPYADMFYWIDFLRWGVGIGGWQIGPDTTIFTEHRTGARFCTVICYESTYPGFVAAFVRKGAEFITIITIDSWWDKMSGAYQHKQFAIFRAIENRRWIARCAVGGISCYIDPYGRTYDATELFTRTTLARTIGRRTDLTFYAEHGDLLGQGCLWFSALFIAASIGQKFKNKKRELQWNQRS